MISPTHGSAARPAAATRRPGRSRKPVGLATPTLNPLLALEHVDAVRSLATLLTDAPTDNRVIATPVAGTPVIGGNQSVGGTQRVLDALSTTDAKMPTRRPAEPGRAA